MAERLARRTEGVREVKNELRVAPEETLSREAREAAEEAGETISDAWITARVAASLRFDSTINHGRIDVSTNDGVVTLEGKVPYLLQKKDAAETAREISGVKGVENRLEVTQWL
jgi:osmotically-inducible protein OsmY